MPAAARGRFEPPGKRLQLFRQYNVSVDTGAFEICRSRPRAPTCRRCRASKSEQLVQAPARTDRTMHTRACISCVEACSCRHCRARPVPCTLLDICMHYAATGRLEHARIALQAYECARELKTHAQPDSFAVTGVQCALALIANMPQAYDDTSHVRRTQQAYACATEHITHAQRAFAR